MTTLLTYLFSVPTALAVSVQQLESNGLITTPFQRFVGLFINGILGVLGSVSLVMLMYASLLWLTDLGDGAKVKKAKTIFIWSIFGLMLIFGSYLLANFIFEATSATT